MAWQHVGNLLDMSFDETLRDRPLTKYRGHEAYPDEDFLITLCDDEEPLPVPEIEPEAPVNRSVAQPEAARNMRRARQTGMTSGLQDRAVRQVVGRFLAQHPTYGPASIDTILRKDFGFYVGTRMKDYCGILCGAHKSNQIFFVIFQNL